MAGINQQTDPGTGDQSKRVLQGVCVMVVDDDPNAREMLSDILALYGAAVLVASSVKQALQMLQEGQPEVIISDVGMPDEDGFDLIRQVRALPPGSGGLTPAIALTGYARPEDKARALSLGYQGFVAKPLDLDELIDKLTLLANRSS